MEAQGKGDHQVTNEVELDALNERVAKVLGWQKLQLGWIRSPKLACPPVNIDDFQGIPAYASDCSFLPEMLAWLIERNMNFEIFFDNHVWYVTAGDPFCDFYTTCNCGTLPEAVASLVVEVAESEEDR